MKLINFLKGLLKKGIRIGYSTGKTFDPHYQKRTSAIDDLTGRTKRLKKQKEEK